MVDLEKELFGIMKEEISNSIDLQVLEQLGADKSIIDNIKRYNYLPREIRKRFKNIKEYDDHIEQEKRIKKNLEQW